MPIAEPADLYTQLTFQPINKFPLVLTEKKCQRDRNLKEPRKPTLAFRKSAGPSTDHFEGVLTRDERDQKLSEVDRDLNFYRQLLIRQAPLSDISADALSEI